MKRNGFLVGFVKGALNAFLVGALLIAPAVLYGGDRIIISNSGGGAAIIEAADCSTYITEGTQCWDTDDNILYIGDGATATVVGPGTASGAIATDTLWDAAGDLAVGTGANTAAKLVKGATGTFPHYNATTIAASAYTLPLVVPTTGKFFHSDGTNMIGSAYTLPAADGTNTYVLATNGSGVVGWAAPGSGLANVVEDLTPQLGGDLDINGKNIYGTNFSVSAAGHLDSAGYGKFNSGIVTTNGATKAGNLIIYEDADDGVNYTELKVVAQVGDISYSLPPDDGDAGEQLQTNGSGVLTWEAAGSGGGAVATDTIFDAAGDLVVGTGSNTSGRLALGASGSFPHSNGTTVVWSPYSMPLTAAANGTIPHWDGTNLIAGTIKDISGAVSGVTSELIGGATARTSSSTTDVLQIEGTTAATVGLQIIQNTNDAFAGNIIFTKTRGTAVGSNTVVADGDTLGAIYWMGADGADTNAFGAYILATADGTQGANKLPASLRFATSPASAQISVERLRISNNGNVGIGTGPTGTDSATPESLFEVQGTEGADSVIQMDADEGDDVADTWKLTSVASDNSFTHVNGTTNVFSITSSGGHDFAGYSTGNGPIYAGLHINGTTAVTEALTDATYIEIIDTQIIATTCVATHTTCDATNDNVDIVTAGTYDVSLTMSLTVDGAPTSELLACAVFKEGVILESVAFDRTMTAATYGVSAARGIVTVAANDTFDVRCSIADATPPNLIVSHLNLTLVRLGD